MIRRYEGNFIILYLKLLSFLTYPTILFIDYLCYGI